MTRPTFAAALAAATLCAVPALAGVDPVPLPLAGATGPVGLAVAIGAYAGYRLLRRKD